MPRTDYDETYANGQLVSRVARIVSDEQMVRDEAPQRLRTAYAALRQWSQDADATASAYDAMTAAQRVAAQKQLITRFGRVCDGLADLLMWLAADR